MKKIMRTLCTLALIVAAIGISGCKLWDKVKEGCVLDWDGRPLVCQGPLLDTN